MAVNPLLEIGKSALFASQSCIQVTGNNIANVNTPGYSRQAVNLEDSLYIDGRPGQMGTGVTATDVFRYFDAFIEAQYNSKATTTVRYGTLWSNLKGVESLFNESNTPGINNSLARFFNDWHQVTNKPDDLAGRSVLVSDAESLVMLINQRDRDLDYIEKGINALLKSSVDEVNTISARIAQLNAEIALHSIEHENNPNGLLDERDDLVRRLAEKLDVTVQQNINGMYIVRTTAGQPLVDGTDCYRLEYEGSQAYATLSIGSPFTGQIEFSGKDSYEYTVEIARAGDVNGSPPAMFRVSIDGGRTWIKDENGQDMLFEAHTLDEKVRVGNLDISFTDVPSPQTLAVGDRFTIVPKDGIYWYKNTSTKENITTQIYPNGQDNRDRITGGEIAGYFELRDRCIGEYREQLNAFARSLAWEVNRQHSQGAGLHFLNDVMGSYTVSHTNIALGDPRSGMAYGQYLEQGNLMVYVYDVATGELVPDVSGPLDFGGGANFNPAVHTLEHVRDAFNNPPYDVYMTADIINGAMHISANAGYAFGFETDTSGLLAAMGINTFFTGSSAADLAVNNTVVNDPALVNVGAINGGFESNEGDAATAHKIAELLTKSVDIRGRFGAVSAQTLSGYYGGTVSRVGSDTSNAGFAYQFNYALATDLNNRQQAVAGVNIDEELTNLIKFQHSFTAASKLITTADQMLQTILSLKQ